jgi:hypothetical protein
VTIGTQAVSPGPEVATATLTLEGPAGQTQQVIPGQTVDLPPGPYRLIGRSPGHFTEYDDCEVRTSGGRCVAYLNPVRAYHLQSPPFGAFSVNPFFQSMVLTDLWLRSHLLADTQAGVTFANRSPRNELGLRNLFTNTELDIMNEGLELAVGVPQVNIGQFQLNLGLIGLIAASQARLKTTSPVNNRVFNREIDGDGLAYGGGAEAVLAWGNFPLALRLAYSLLNGEADGDLDNPSEIDDTFFGFNIDDTEVDLSWTTYRLRADLLWLMTYNLAWYVGMSFMETSASVETRSTGTVGAVATERLVRQRYTSQNEMFHAGLQWLLGPRFGVLAPLGGRVEVGFGTCGCYEVFAKVGWLFGAYGSWSPIPSSSRLDSFNRPRVE